MRNDGFNTIFLHKHQEGVSGLADLKSVECEDYGIVDDKSLAVEWMIGLHMNVPCCPGLTFGLLRKMGHLVQFQRICIKCGFNFMRECPSSGCNGGGSGKAFYQSLYTCDLKGPCTSCARKTFR